MGMFEQVSVASDRVIEALVAGLEIEFGRGAGEALAQRFLTAEEVDFCWESRLAERWLGYYGRGEDERDIELDRVRIVGFLDGKWFVATMIVDGDGIAHGMTGRREFMAEGEALAAYTDA
ncbi:MULTISPECIES: hypothetical protein [unclassified Sphingomonas]|jgi:hypothetical protein|uniref:hypothetical protein n=1 Tax=unclassified Sphingomonas TaxID=196159 RepID=UPI002151F425|nr:MULTISPECIES: hypothetical protein [unclassified Sphingomonas]MCR5871021.1 hypothetical protein [Sphingomonas sp. J344]UUY00658.1 hypothetical protein LRS08_06170 [Sphingomonas sp. J315]